MPKKIIRYISFILIQTVLLTAVTGCAVTDDSVPVMTEAAEDRFLSSRAAVMTDLTVNKVCYEKNSRLRLPVASLTKMMTTLVAIETEGFFEREFVFTDDIIHRMKDANASVAGFLPGESAGAWDLLYGIMLPSGGDAALAAAILVSGSEEAFTERMNERALELGMKDTHFSDATGLDDHGSYSTAADMSLLFAAALENDIFSEIITAQEYMTSATPQHKNGILFRSTLSDSVKEYSLEGKILGGKTGYTEGAGLCLATYAELEGHKYILVTLGAGDGSKYPSYHFEDAAVLYDKYYLT